MLEKIFLFCKGYVIVKIEEAAKERFLNLCKAKEIEIIDIVSVNSSIYGKMTGKDYLKIKPIVKKTHCCPSIQKKVGLPFVSRKLQKRKGILVGVCLSLFLLLQLTGRIWYIDVTGGFVHTREQIVQLLKTDMQVYAGMGSEAADCMEIEERIRLIYNEIGWVSVEKKGCNLYIRLNESVMPDIPEMQEKICHVVAEKDGVVRKIEVISGIAQVHVGDTVKKGDILISGIMPMVGDYDELIENRPVGAKGNVYIESEFSYHVVYSMQKEEKTETGQRKGVALFFKEQKLFSYIPRYSEGKYDIITTDIVPFVFLDFQVPFLIRIYQLRSYETEIKKVAISEAERKAQTAWEAFLSDWRAQGVEIRKEAFSVETDAAQCKASGSGIALGNFISYREIKSEEWMIDDEYSGDNS